MDKMSAEKDKLLEQFKCLSEKCNLYIVGAGRCGTVLGKWMNQNGIDWKGYLDKTTFGNVLNDKKVFNSYALKDINDYFIISSVNFSRDSMKEDLKKQGISDERIFLIDYDVFYEIYEATDNWKTYTERIKQFKGRHHNQRRCFIIGNGPSLKIQDLEKLRSEVSFAANCIYAVYENTNWRPNYYFPGSNFCNIAFDNKKNIKKIISGCEAAFVSSLGKGFQYRDDEDFPNLYFFRSNAKLDDDTCLPCFSDDCSEMIYGSGTVTYCMLQMAVYMGFDEIYLLGMDFTFSHERHKDNTTTFNDVQNHMEQIEREQAKFYKSEEEIQGYYYLSHIDKQKEGYLAAKKYADEHGIKIYNATRGGKLEVFERVDFDTLFID